MIYKQVQREHLSAGLRRAAFPGGSRLWAVYKTGLRGNVIKFSELLDVDAVIATHLTAGAFDGEARRLIPQGDEGLCTGRGGCGFAVCMDGFSNLEILDGNDRVLPSEHSENTGFLPSERDFCDGSERRAEC